MTPLLVKYNTNISLCNGLGNKLRPPQKLYGCVNQQLLSISMTDISSTNKTITNAHLTKTQQARMYILALCCCDKENNISKLLSI